MVLFLRIALLALICFTAERATAQDAISDPYYDILSQKLIRYQPKDFDFSLFRSYYTLTDQYDPLGDNTRKKMITLSYAAKNDTDPEKRKSARTHYGELLAQHLANMDVVSQALVLAEQDRSFGNPEFLRWIRAGLLRDILNSGDGKSLIGAYDVVTLGEEPLLLGALHLKVLESESAESGGVYYTMHKIENPGGEPYWLFVDTSRPLAFLAQKQAEQGNIFSIRKQ